MFFYVSKSFRFLQGVASYLHIVFHLISTIGYYILFNSTLNFNNNPGGGGGGTFFVGG